MTIGPRPLEALGGRCHGFLEKIEIDRTIAEMTIVPKVEVTVHPLAVGVSMVELQIEMPPPPYYQQSWL